MTKTLTEERQVLCDLVPEREHFFRTQHTSPSGRFVKNSAYRSKDDNCRRTKTVCPDIEFVSVVSILGTLEDITLEDITWSGEWTITHQCSLYSPYGWTHDTVTLFTTVTGESMSSRGVPSDIETLSHCFFTHICSRKEMLRVPVWLCVYFWRLVYSK